MALRGSAEKKKSFQPAKLLNIYFCEKKVALVRMYTVFWVVAKII